MCNRYIKACVGVELSNSFSCSILFLNEAQLYYCYKYTVHSFLMSVRTRPVTDPVPSSQYWTYNSSNMTLSSHPQTHRHARILSTDRMASSLNNSFFNICPEAALLPFVHLLSPKACHPALIKQKMVINISLC